MKTKAAVLYEVGKPIEIEEIELDGPREHEVLIRYTHAGLCHSDLHAVHGDLPVRMPTVLGHEGAGVVEEVGRSVTRVKPGDHVVCSFIPSCGTCRYCATGRQNLCNLGSTSMEGCMPDGHFPRRGRQGDYGALALLGTFSQYGTILEGSVVKVDSDLELGSAVLVGCGVPTGWGAAVNSAAVKPGHTVVVAGVGGIGINAVQGARMAGARDVIAIDPLEFKRENALSMGATHAFKSFEDAAQDLAHMTNGQGADSVILTAGLVGAELVQEGFTATGKGGNLVVVGLAGFDDLSVALPGTFLTLYQKTVKGSLFGECNPTYDIPMLLGHYRTGDLKLDELVTRTYTLEQVNEGYEDLQNGKNVRGVIVHEHD